MAGSAMSISDGPYTDLTFSDRHVYATLDKTPPLNSLGVRSTGQSSPPHRQAAVALGILCAILLTATITLCVLYPRQRVLQKPNPLNNSCSKENDRLQEEYTTLSHENDLLQKDYTTLSHENNLLQKDYTTLSHENDLLQKDYTTLSHENNLLQEDNKNLSIEKDQLQEDYKNLSIEKDQLQEDYKNLSTAKDQLQEDYKNLSTAKDQLQEDYKNLSTAKDQLQEDYKNLSTAKDQLQEDYNKLLNEKDQLEKEQISAEGILAQLYELFGISSSCPEGWKLFSSKCYFFSTEKRTWDNSRKYCSNREADLVVVNNQDEQEFINKNAIGGHYWIGLQDMDRTFVWVDGTPLQKAFWKAGSPDQNRGPSRHAVLTGPGEELWVDTQRTHTWMWICERSPPK